MTHPTNTMAVTSRAEATIPTGLPVGSVPWGTHLCQLYRTPQDLVELLAPFFAAGLASNERCLWVTGPQLSVDEARAALAPLVPDLDACLASGQLELVATIDRGFELDRVIASWVDRAERAVAAGYEGLRITGATWFDDYEHQVQQGLRNHKLLAVCCYALDHCGADQLTDLLRVHKHALIRSGGKWEQITSATAALALVAPPVTQSRVSNVHSVEFFERTGFPAAGIARRIADALEAGHGGGALADAEHLAAIRAALGELVDVDARLATGQLAFVDARAVHAALVAANGSLEPLERMVATPVRALAQQFGRVRFYGELVDIYCQEGDRPGAIELERWWNRQLETAPIELHCGYTIDSFDDPDSLHAFRHVCEEHATVVPAASATNGDGRLAAELHQVSTVLESETARRSAFASAYEGSRIAELATREHLVTLQRVTSALCEAATYAELAQVVAIEWPRVLGATKLALAIGSELVLVRGITTPDDPPAVVRDLERRAASWGPADGSLWIPAETIAVKPLTSSRGTRIATLVLGFEDAGPVGAARALADDLARQLAIAIDRARSYEEADRQRERAETANAAKDNFLAMLGHELRNPLSPILTATQLMRLRAPDSLVKERQIVERNVAHMIRIVDDLLDVSRIAGGKVQITRSTIDLSEIVAQAVERTSGLLEERAHRLEVEVPPGLTLLADPARLVQVIANLIGNAAKYTKSAGTIAIKAERASETVQLSVIDNGVGIAPELLARVFELFVQGPQGVDRAKGGLGLGLPIARKIIELHGGTIRAASAGPGQGSQFTITLPIRAAKPVGEPKVSSGNARRILVVDDNEDAAWLLAEGLRIAGHDVRVSHDGLQALEVARAFLPQIAFLDVGLPGLDGYGLCRELLELSVRPKVVAVTGYGQATDRDRSRAAGFDLHFVKPVSLREMQGAIEAFK
jgi:signal transduction histidine kinase